MKEYCKRSFRSKVAEAKINLLALDGWQVIDIDEPKDLGYTFVWFERGIELFEYEEEKRRIELQNFIDGERE